MDLLPVGPNPTGGHPPSWKISNDHICGMGYPIHSTCHGIATASRQELPVSQKYVSPMKNPPGQYTVLGINNFPNSRVIKISLYV